jgi:hypothetical protein
MHGDPALSRKVVDVSACAIAMPEINAKLPELREPALLVLQAQDHRVARALLRAVLQVLLRGVKEKLI